jgi:hypothetical protein
MGTEVSSMAIDVKVKLVPWDDPPFVAAFQSAAMKLADEGLRLDTAGGALALQRELRASGYANATCYCERTVEEALAHRTRCVVSRDGPGPLALGGATAG